MKNELFDTEEKVAQAIAAFRSLLTHPGWKLLEQLLDEDIENLRNDLETIKDETETKEDIDLARYKLSFSKEHRNKPADMIKKLETPEGIAPNPDPYPTADSLKEERNKAT